MSYVLVSCVFLCSSVPVATAAPDPLKRVHQLAHRHERSLAKDVEQRPAPEHFIVDAHAATAALVNALDGDYDLIRVKPGRIETDWHYGSRSGTHSIHGEWLEQRRQRVLISLSGTPVVSATVRVIKESRTLMAGQPEPPWQQEKADADERALESRITQVLSELEEATLARARLDVEFPELRSHLQAALPPAYTLDELDDQRGFVVRRRTTELVQAKRKRPPTTWERELRIEVHVPEPTPPYSLRMSSSEWNRYAVGDNWTDWELSEVTDPRPARDLRLGLVRSLNAQVSLGEEVSIPEVDTPLSTPPPAPSLRTIAEIQSQNLDKARSEGIAMGRGWFRVSLTRAIISPNKSDGSTWDMSLQSVAGPASALAIRFTQVPTLAEHASALAEYAAAQYPTSPDVKAAFAIGDVRRVLPVVGDTVLPTWGTAVIDHPFYGMTDPLVFVRLEDEDVLQNDLIGECSYSLRDILASETGEFRCGEANIELKASWLRPL